TQKVEGVPPSGGEFFAEPRSDLPLEVCLTLDLPTYREELHSSPDLSECHIVSEPEDFRSRLWGPILGRPELPLACGPALEPSLRRGKKNGPIEPPRVGLVELQPEQVSPRRLQCGLHAESVNTRNPSPV